MLKRQNENRTKSTLREMTSQMIQNNPYCDNIGIVTISKYTSNKTMGVLSI